MTRSLRESSRHDEVASTRAGGVDTTSGLGRGAPTRRRRATREAAVTAVRLAAVVGGLAAAVVAAAWLLQERLIYLPYGQPGAPAAVSLSHAEEVGFYTDDGVALDAWYVPAEGAAAGTVLLLPGNAGNRALRAPLAAALSARGVSVLLVDYRGYGGNPGRPSAAGVLADARAARRYLLERGDVDPDGIVYFGESVGTGVAAQLAVEHPPRGLVLRSPFTSLADVGARHYPFLPVRLLLRGDVDVVDRVATYDGRVLVIAGERDRVVPPEQSRRVAAAAGAELVVVPGADHNDRALLDGDVLLDAVTGFLSELGLSS